MIVVQSKTFCILPWIHIYANPDGSVLPCCIGHHHKHMGNVQHNTIEEIFNNTKYNNMRLNMLDGKKCDECTACYQLEDKGIKSFRQSKNEEFSKFSAMIDYTNDDGSLSKIDFKYFDLRWSNICNFKCRTCSSTYSSSWAIEDNVVAGAKKKVFIFAGGDTNDDLYNQFLPYFSGIEEFYFAGGEPLLTDKHYDILEYLISIGRTDVKLSYNTNLSNLIYKNKSILELWQQFSSISVRASLDSWQDRAEYIREGTDWKLIEQNILDIQTVTPHVDLQISTVISVFNIATLSDFLDYLFEKNLFKKNKFFPSFYNIQHPNYYSTSVIPNDIKQNIISKLSNVNYTPYIDRQIKNAISYLENSNFSIEDNKNFILETEKYDKIRNRKFSDTFPEIHQIVYENIF
jgi:radical SAM protein with 4Fe4S-binding SPASM domain